MNHNEPLRILIVDNEANMRRVLEAWLQREGYRTVTAVNGKDALKQMKAYPSQIVITDLKMPVMDGMEVLKHINETCPDVPVIIITAHGTVENAVESMKHGAFDYITKPFDLTELKHIVQKASAMYHHNRQQLHSTSPTITDGIVVASKQIRDILSMVERVAPSPTTILITGESGTGKELIAQLIHRKSPRYNKPFIRVNCAAVPDTLLESEFFGYEKGAFTGAVTSKPGRFELADGGTLFLDEIGEISRETQVKLLRVLQEREFERVGGLKTIKVDVRLVVATNMDLEAAVEKGTFRRDLFYRLNVVPIHLPPLRERIEDIPPLVTHFIDVFNKRLQRDIRGISPEAMSILKAYPWPGNIRELENIMERSMLLASTDILTPADFTSLIPEGAGAEMKHTGNLKDIIQTETDRLERQLLEEALRETGGNVTRAAKKLGLSRKGLQLKMKRHGLRSKDLKK